MRLFTAKKEGAAEHLDHTKLYLMFPSDSSETTGLPVLNIFFRANAKHKRVHTQEDSLMSQVPPPIAL